VLCIATFGATQEIGQYADVAAPPGVWMFINAWMLSTLGIMCVWMWKLR
jgi:hypothetical protein